MAETKFDFFLPFTPALSYERNTSYTTFYFRPSVLEIDMNDGLHRTWKAYKAASIRRVHSTLSKVWVTSEKESNGLDSSCRSSCFIVPY